MASSRQQNPASPVKIIPAGSEDHESIQQTGMLSDYFAQSDAKIETRKAPKFSVYYQTNKIVSNQDIIKRGHLSTRGDQSRSGKAFRPMDEQSAQYMETVDMREGDLPRLEMKNLRSNLKSNYTMRQPLENRSRLATTTNMQSVNLIGQRVAMAGLVANNSAVPSRVKFMNTNSVGKIHRPGCGPYTLKNKSLARVTQKTDST